MSDAAYQASVAAKLSAISMTPPATAKKQTIVSWKRKPFVSTQMAT
jgi:hypothetical protein